METEQRPGQRPGQRSRQRPEHRVYGCGAVDKYYSTTSGGENITITKHHHKGNLARTFNVGKVYDRQSKDQDRDQDSYHDRDQDRDQGRDQDRDGAKTRTETQRIFNHNSNTLFCRNFCSSVKLGKLLLKSLTCNIWVHLHQVTGWMHQLTGPSNPPLPLGG